MKLVIASNNSGKLKEFKAIIGHRFEAVLSMREVGIDMDIPEDGMTFEENATTKAQTVFDLLSGQYAVLADDSGLMVDALGGAPGVYSARYAGSHGSTADNNRKLLANMTDVTDRSARFVCCLVLIIGARKYVATGATEGSILYAEEGSAGFGYDPLFLSADLGCSFGVASAEAKNSISHRGRALQALLHMLEDTED